MGTWRDRTLQCMFKTLPEIPAELIAMIHEFLPNCIDGEDFELRALSSWDWELLGRRAFCYPPWLKSGKSGGRITAQFLFDEDTSELDYVAFDEYTKLVARSNILNLSRTSDIALASLQDPPELFICKDGRTIEVWSVSWQSKEDSPPLLVRLVRSFVLPPELHCRTAIPLSLAVNQGGLFVWKHNSPQISVLSRVDGTEQRVVTIPGGKSLGFAVSETELFVSVRQFPGKETKETKARIYVLDLEQKIIPSSQTPQELRHWNLETLRSWYSESSGVPSLLYHALDEALWESGQCIRIYH